MSEESVASRQGGGTSAGSGSSNPTSTPPTAPNKPKIGDKRPAPPTPASNDNSGSSNEGGGRRRRRGNRNNNAKNNNGGGQQAKNKGDNDAKNNDSNNGGQSKSGSGRRRRRPLPDLDWPPLLESLFLASLSPLFFACWPPPLLFLALLLRLPRRRRRPPPSLEEPELSFEAGVGGAGRLSPIFGLFGAVGGVLVGLDDPLPAEVPPPWRLATDSSDMLFPSVRVPTGVRAMPGTGRLGPCVRIGICKLLNNAARVRRG